MAISSTDVHEARLNRLQGYLAHDPDNLTLLADAADEALRVGRSDVARTMVQYALELRHNDPFFRLRLSSVAISEGNFDEALELTTGLLREGRDDAPIRYNHAFVLASTARYAEAAEILETLHAEQAPLANVASLLIRCHHYLGNLERAVAVAQARLAATPDDGRVAGMLSLLYFDGNDLAQAGEWSRRALELDPRDLDALLAAGGVALAGEDATQATELAQQAIGVQPKNGRAWTNLGLAELLAFDLKGARDALSTSVRYMPGHIGTWIALGWTQLLLDDVDGAETSFRSALNLDANFGETHGGLAAVAALRGRWDEAETEAKVAHRLDPGSLSPQYVQLVKLRGEGDPAAVFRLLRRVMANTASPSGDRLLDMLARARRR